MVNHSMVLKEYLDSEDYKFINDLKNQCINFDKTSLKLELDYKLMTAKNSDISTIKDVNEFLYYSGDKLVGYIGICNFGGSTLEVSGMVHPRYRRKGIFTKLFEFLKEEWLRRGNVEILLLSDQELHFH